MKVQIATAAAIKAADAKQTAIYVEQAIEKCRQSLQAFHGQENPQVVRMRERAEAQKDALEAVLNSLRGNHVDIRLYT